MPALSRFACANGSLSLSGCGCCAFGDATINKALRVALSPIGLNGGRIMPQIKRQDKLLKFNAIVLFRLQGSVWPIL